MTETEKILDLAKRKLSLTSDNQLARALSWGQPTVSGYRTGRRQMDCQQVLDFAEKTGIDALAVLRASVTDKKNMKRGRKIQGSLNLQISA